MQAPLVNPPPAVDSVGEILGYVNRFELDQATATLARSREELAIALFAETDAIISLTRNISADGHRTSAQLIEELEEQEEAEHYDHLVAIAISEDRPIPPRPQRRVRSLISQLISQVDNQPMSVCLCIHDFRVLTVCLP